MTDPVDREVRAHFNSRSRKISVVKSGSTYRVPLKYDDSGHALTAETFDARKHLKTLSLDDWRFLECWQRHGWDVGKAMAECEVPEDKARRLCKKLDAFRQEEIRDKALAAIPTTSFIQARHVESLYSPPEHKLTDADQKSLSELAKITGSYKTTASVNIQNNFFQMPKMTPEQEAELRALGDKLSAIDAEAV